MLIAKVFVNKQQIGILDIHNTGERTDGGAIYRVTKHAGDTRHATDGVPLYFLHNSNDGAWTCVRKAIERIEEIERFEDSEARSVDPRTLARKLHRMPSGNDAGHDKPPS